MSVSLMLSRTKLVKHEGIIVLILPDNEADEKYYLDISV